MNKPRDMLEFFRRTAPADPEVGSTAPSLQPTTRMLVLRRSQVIVASAAAAAALLLALLVGHALGAAGAFKAEVYVIRAAEYGDDEKGQGSARKLKEQLEKMDLGDEVQILHVPSESRTVVAVGSWLSHPGGRKDACDLRDKLRGLKGSTQAMPLANAEFWRMER